jgi:hypothetical protein
VSVLPGEAHYLTREVGRFSFLQKRKEVRDSRGALKEIESE